MIQSYKQTFLSVSCMQSCDSILHLIRLYDIEDYILEFLTNFLSVNNQLL